MFPLADWAYFLLSVITLAAGIYLVIELSAEWLAREKLAAVPFLLAAIPFFNFLGLKWDQNSLLIPLWALAMWAMLRALATRHLGWAALAGLAAAAAMLTKYWSVFLLAALAFAALADQRRVAYFTLAPRPGSRPASSSGGRAARLVAGRGELSAGHVGHDAADRRRRAADLWSSFGKYVGGTVAYAGPALLLVLAFVRPTRAAIADSWFPRDERRSATILFWTPLLLPVRAGNRSRALSCCRCGTSRRSTCCR